MSRKLFVCLTLSLLALVVGATTTQAQNFKWWKDDRFIKELALTPDQIARIDSVFQAPQPTLRAQKRALDKLEDELSAMIHDPKVEEAELEAFISRVEAVKSELSKSRSIMIVRMSRVLTAEQSTKLHRLFEERDKQRRERPHDKKPKQQR